MTMRKRFVAILSAVLFLFTLSSCTTEEIGFYNTWKSLMNMDEFTFEGTVVFKVNDLQIPEDNDSIDLSQLEAIKDDTLIYQGEIKKDTMSLHVFLKKADKSTEDILRLLAKDNFLYVAGDLGMTKGRKAIPVKTIDGIEYAEWDVKELVDGMFYNVEESLERFDGIPEYDDSKSEYYNYGFTSGYNYGGSDVINGTTSNQTNYDTDYMDALTAEEAAEYRSGFDAGYSEGTLDATEALAEAEKAIEALQPLKTEMMNKASVSYMIKMYRNLMFKVSDMFVKDFFKNIALNLVKKVSGSQYEIKLDNDVLMEALGSIGDNEAISPDKAMEAISALIEDLSDEELIILGCPPSKREMILDMLSLLIGGVAPIDDPSLGDDDDLDLGDDNLDLGDDDNLNPVFDPSMFDWSYVSSLKKTGIQSYELNDTLSYAVTDEEGDDIGFSLDMDVIHTLMINKEGIGNLGSQAKTEKTGDGTAIRVKATNPNAGEYGIVYSTTSDFKNPIFVKGTRQSDGSYLVSLNSLGAGAYYYKTYLTDENGNTILEETMQTVEVTSNPKTGDSTAYAWTLVSLFTALGAAALTVRRTRRSAAK